MSRWRAAARLSLRRSSSGSRCRYLPPENLGQSSANPMRTSSAANRAHRAGNILPPYGRVACTAWSANLAFPRSGTSNHDARPDHLENPGEHSIVFALSSSVVPLMQVAASALTRKLTCSGMGRTLLDTRYHARRLHTRVGTSLGTKTHFGLTSA